MKLPNPVGMIQLDLNPFILHFCVVDGRTRQSNAEWNFDHIQNVVSNFIVPIKRAGYQSVLKAEVKAYIGGCGSLPFQVFVSKSVLNNSLLQYIKWISCNTQNILVRIISDILISKFSPGGADLQIVEPRGILQKLFVRQTPRSRY